VRPMVWDMVVIWVRAISTSGWYCVAITCFRAKIAQRNCSACSGGKERGIFKICFCGAISNSSCTNFSLRVGLGSNVLGNTPRPEHFGIPQRITTRHPKNIYHYILHFPPLLVPSAIMSAPQSVQCFGKKKTGTAESPSHDQESVAK
jgi:hypothetical protein